MYVQGSRNAILYVQDSILYVQDSRIAILYVQDSRIAILYVQGRRNDILYVQGSRNAILYVQDSILYVQDSQYAILYVQGTILYVQDFLFIFLMHVVSRASYKGQGIVLWHERANVSDDGPTSGQRPVFAGKKITWGAFTLNSTGLKLIYLSWIKQIVYTFIKMNKA